MEHRELFEELVKVMRAYLGPAAERFVVRQIDFHLSKPPSALKKEDLSSLENSFKISLTKLTNNTKVADEVAEKLKALKS